MKPLRPRTAERTASRWARLRRIACLALAATVFLLPAVASAQEGGSPATGGSSAAQLATVPVAPEAEALGLLVSWYELQLAMIRETSGFSPPVAARALAYAGIAQWEALAPSAPGARSLAGQLNGLDALPAAPREGYDALVAVNAALAESLRGLYPNALAAHLAAVDDLERTHERAAAERLDPQALERSRDHGRTVARHVLAWAASDGGHEGYLTAFSGFTPASAPGAWVPTPRRNGPPFPPLQPTWGENRPLVLASGESCMAPPPPAYSEEPSSALYQEAREVYDTVRNLSPEQATIARFWSDDPGQTSTPAGHWVSILNGVVADRAPDIALASEAYARLGIAMNDAFISCWTTKYRYNLLRPITYIQRVIDPTWNADAITDPVITPPFPEYTSGHSVASAAAAGALTHVLGAVAFTDPTHLDRGLAPRRYASFEDAAQEAAISRLYGGIHFRAAIEDGMAQGACVAERVNALAFR